MVARATQAPTGSRPETATPAPPQLLPLAPGAHGEGPTDRTSAIAAAELLAPGISELGVPVTVSRAVTTEAPSGTGTSGGSEAPTLSAAAEAPAGSTAPATAGGSGPAGAGGGGEGGGPEQVEALAQKLLIPMLRRIKAELLLDRERHGLRTDTW